MLYTRLTEERRFYICSLSARTVVYKGQFDPCQLWQYYTDLQDERLTTHLCIVHTRNTGNTVTE